jgi:hypothetical protein
MNKAKLTLFLRLLRIRDVYPGHQIDPGSGIPDFIPRWIPDLDPHTALHTDSDQKNIFFCISESIFCKAK